MADVRLKRPRRACVVTSYLTPKEANKRARMAAKGNSKEPKSKSPMKEDIFWPSTSTTPYHHVCSLCSRLFVLRSTFLKHELECIECFLNDGAVKRIVDDMLAIVETDELTNSAPSVDVSTSSTSTMTAEYPLAYLTTDDDTSEAMSVDKNLDQTLDPIQDNESTITVSADQQDEDTFALLEASAEVVTFNEYNAYQATLNSIVTNSTLEDLFEDYPQLPVPPNSPASIFEDNLDAEEPLQFKPEYVDILTEELLENLPKALMDL